MTITPLNAFPHEENLRSEVDYLRNQIREKKDAGDLQGARALQDQLREKVTRALLENLHVYLISCCSRFLVDILLEKIRITIPSFRNVSVLIKKNEDNPIKQDILLHLVLERKERDNHLNSLIVVLYIKWINLIVKLIS